MKTHQKKLHWILGAASSLCAAGIFLGCGGDASNVSAGEYAFYRVALSTSEKSASCFTTKAAPIEEGPTTTPKTETRDSSNVRKSGTFILYAGADEKLYLDIGEVTLEGSVKEEMLTFEGKTVKETTVTGGAEGTLLKQTATNTVSVTIKVTDRAVSGTIVETLSTTCSGSSCGDPVPSCSETRTFVGTAVDDVELKHDV